MKKVRGKEAAPTMRGPGEAEMEAAGKSVYQVYSCPSHQKRPEM